MRNNDPIFWPEEALSLSLKQSMNKNYTDCINILQTQWYQFDLDQRFYMGDQDLWGLIFPGVATYRRKIFNFNLINSHIQMVTGYQRRNRKSTICQAVLPGPSKTADQITKCLFHVHNNDNLYETYSNAFELGALVQGLGFVGFHLDHTSDPISGDIRGRYIDPKSCLFDPYFRKMDMSDCRFFWTRQFFDREEAANLYQDFHDEILALPKGTYRDDKFYYMPEVYQIQFPNLIAFDEYWYLSQRQATFLVDVETNECQEFTGDEEDLRYIYSTFKDRLKIIKKPKPTVRRAVVLNDRVMVDEPNPYGLDCYPYVPFLGYFSADSPYYAYKFRGITRDLRDAQYLFNLRKVTDLDILQSQQQGLKIKKGALVTPEDGLNQGNGRILSIDPKFQMDDVQPMPIIPPAPIMIQMEEMLGAVMNQISGVNETMIGVEQNDDSGLKTMLRNSAGVTTLTKLFDNCDYAQRLCGDLIVQMIQKNWSYGKIKQVIGEEPTSEFDNKAFFKYNCKVVQGALTESQQQLNFIQMVYLKEKGLVDFSSRDLLEASNIQNRDELMQRLDQKEKAAMEQQNKMMELQMQQMQVDNQTKISYAHSQEGLAAERTAKIQLDKALNAERLSRAEEERQEGALNIVRAAKEVVSMDLDHLERGLGIVKMITEDEKASAEKKSAQNQQPIGVS